MIKLKNIFKSYDKDKSFVLNDVSLTIEKGEFIAITGPSGSGKSTLLNILGTIDNKFKGIYTFNNANIVKLSSKELAKFRNENLGYIFQEHMLLEYLSAYENVYLPIRYSKNKNNTNNVDNLLKVIGMTKKRDALAIGLSGGEKQRVAIGRALVNEPSIIIADEPTGSLDYENSQIIFDLLKDINKKGTTVIVVTHDMEMAKRFDRHIQIKQGELLE